MKIAPKLNKFLKILSFLVFGHAAHAIEHPSVLGDWKVGHQVLKVSTEDGAYRAMDVDLWFPTSVSPQNSELTIYPRVPHPPETSRHAISTTEFAEGAPFELIVYSHGADGRATENSFLAESLASNGFVVASTAHLDGGLPPVPSSADDRARDISTIIDVLLDRSSTETDILYKKISTGGVGVAGFSYGGWTAMSLVGGSTHGDIEVDDRIKAIMPIARGMDPPLEPENVEVPTLLFSGEQDEFGLQVTARRDLSAISPTNPSSVLALYDGADHVDVGWSYCQRSPIGTECGNDDVMSIESVLAAAFFETYLRDSEAYTDVLTPEFGVQFGTSLSIWRGAFTDTNGDGVTDFADFLALSDAFGKTGGLARRSKADFNGDRIVDFKDFLLLNYNFSSRPPNAGKSVPEPHSITLGLLASAFILLRRARRAH